MRAPPAIRFERFTKLMQRINYESEKGGVIVVEGPHDRESLRAMGITGEILCLQSSRKSALGFADELRNVRDVIVLTDFDREGVILAKKLQRFLTSQKVRANLYLWRELRQLTRSHIRSIEELLGFSERLRNEAHGF